MKLIFILVTCLIPMAGWSQGVWESPVTEMNNINNNVSSVKEKKQNPDAKYLAGAVPEVMVRLNGNWN